MVTDILKIKKDLIVILLDFIYNNKRIKNKGVRTCLKYILS